MTRDNLTRARIVSGVIAIALAVTLWGCSAPAQAPAPEADPQLTVIVGSIGADETGPVSVGVINTGPALTDLHLGLSADGSQDWRRVEVEWQIVGPLREGDPIATGAGGQAPVEFRAYHEGGACRELVAYDVTATGHVSPVRVTGDRYVLRGGHPPLRGSC